MQILVEAERIEYIQQEYDKQRNGWGMEYLGNYVQAGIASVCNMSGGTLADWWSSLVAGPQVEKVKSSRARSSRALWAMWKSLWFLYFKACVPTKLKAG